LFVFVIEDYSAEEEEEEKIEEVVSIQESAIEEDAEIKELETWEDL